MPRAPDTARRVQGTPAPSRPVRGAGASRRLALLVGLGAALYFVLGAILLASGGAFSLEQGFASGAVRVMDALSPDRLHRSVEVHPTEHSAVQLEYHYRVLVDGKQHGTGARYHLHAHNFVLFAALALAIPGLAWAPRLLVLALGLCGVFLLDVLFVMGDLWRVEYLHLPEAAAANSFGPSGWIARHLWRFHPTGSVFFAPVFVLGFFLLLWPQRGRREAGRSPGTARTGRAGRPARSAR